MATVSDVFDICYSRAKRAQRNEDATPEELFKVLQEVMARWFSVGQMINLEWFTVRANVDYNTTHEGWPRPTVAERVHRVEWQPGKRVAKVPFDKPDTEPYLPAIYRLNQVYYVASVGDPPRIGGNPPPPLTFFYCRRPELIEAEAGELDSMWPVGHETLLGLELALFLMRKDPRPAEAEGITAMRDESAAWFREFMSHEDTGTIYEGEQRRRWSHGPSVPGGV